MMFFCMKTSGGDAKIIELLLSHNADPNTQDEVYYILHLSSVIII